jgi:hypothetical protein
LTGDIPATTNTNDEMTTRALRFILWLLCAQILVLAPNSVFFH